MSDLIRRNAAIDVIWDVFNQYCNDSDRFDEYETKAINRAFKRLQSTLEKQPTIYDDWIPCNKNLPEFPKDIEDEKDYLVTVRRNDGHIFWDKLTYHHFGWSIPSTCEVIAWQEVTSYQPKEL